MYIDVYIYIYSQQKSQQKSKYAHRPAETNPQSPTGTFNILQKDDQHAAIYVTFAGLKPANSVNILQTF